MEPGEMAPEAQVTQLYRLLLQREPDANGLRHHAALLRENRMSFRQMIQAFVQSDEFASAKEQQVRVSAYGCEFVLPAGGAAAVIGAERYESWLIPYFLDTCEPGMTVLDIGANWGALALPAAKRVGETGRVWAVEVSPMNCEVLARSIKASAIDNVEILPLALSDRLGSELMVRRFGAETNSILSGLDVAANKIKDYHVVPVVSLDLLAPALGRVHVVKMDIDGMEHRVAKGGLEFFKAQQPIVFLEYSPQLQQIYSGVDGRDLLGLFMDLGYGMEIVHRTRPRETVSTTDREAAISRVDGVWLDHVEQEQGTHLDLCLRVEA